MSRRALTSAYWLAPGLLTLTLATSADAQQTGTQPGVGSSSAGSRSTGTTAGSPAATQQSTGGSNAFGGLAQQVQLTPEQELQILMDAITTVETMVQDSGIQFSEEELFFLLMIVYHVEREQALLGTLGGQTASPTTGTTGP